jgi:hypothetical protein
LQNLLKGASQNNRTKEAVRIAERHYGGKKWVL